MGFLLVYIIWSIVRVFIEIAGNTYNYQAEMHYTIYLSLWPHFSYQKEKIVSRLNFCDICSVQCGS